MSEVNSFVQGPTVLIVYLESVWSYSSHLSDHDDMVFLGKMAVDVLHEDSSDILHMTFLLLKFHGLSLVLEELSRSRRPCWISLSKASDTTLDSVIPLPPDHSAAGILAFRVSH